VDTWLVRYDPALLRRQGKAGEWSWFVDLGFGAEPLTTLQSASILRRVNPQLPILGVEIDPERVTTALSFSDELTQFRVGGFNLPLETGESVRAIRAFNVLRQYEEKQAAEATLLLIRQVQPGGLLIEGTSDPFGRVWTANILRRSKPEGTITHRVEGLLLSTNFHSGFDPAMFQPVLPKNLIHHMLPGEPIFEFFETWKACARETVSFRSLGLRQWFAASAKALQQHGVSIDARPRFLRAGYLLWNGPT
jgi:hypothetical protein